MPYLTEMNRVYKDDIVYSEGEVADEVFFVLEGAVQLHFDCAGFLPEKYKAELKVFNVPFAVQDKRSSFGEKADFYGRRQETAVASKSSHIVKISCASLELVLRF